MYDQKKVDRVNELVREIKEREMELEGIFGGDAPKRTWSRKPKIDEAKQEGSPAT
jgi:hypothetical protein